MRPLGKKYVKEMLTAKADYFDRLMCYLFMCTIFYEYRNTKLSYDYFPPSPRDVEHCRETIKKVSAAKEKPYNKVIQKGLTPIKSRTSNWYQRVMKSIEELEIQKFDSFDPVTGFCMLLREMNKNLLQDDEPYRDPIKEIKETEELGTLVISKANQLVGYWTAKMERSRSAKKSNLPKIKRRLELETKIEEVYAKHKGLTGNFFDEVKKKTGLTEDYIKRIAKNKIARKRKED